MSNKILHVEGPMWWISVSTNLFITWVVVGLALAFGSIYADFKAENKTVAMGSMGAILFLLFATAFQIIIIFIGANPVYRIVKRWLNNYAFNSSDLYLLILWIIISVVLSVGIVIFFFKKGIRTLENS